MAEKKDGITEGALKVDVYMTSPPWKLKPQNPARGLPRDLQWLSQNVTDLSQIVTL